MSSIKKIRNKIESIYNTKKITKAMAMISISKIRKVQNKIYRLQPYFKAIKKIVSHMKVTNLGREHIYYQSRIVKRVGIIIVSTDKGLCGSLNANLFKEVLMNIKKYRTNSIECDLIIVGVKGLIFFSSFRKNVIFKMKGIADDLCPAHLSDLVLTALNVYKEKRIDKLFIANNVYNNTMSLTPTLTPLLPIYSIPINLEKRLSWDYIYEPNSKILVNNLLNRYLESQIYQNVLGNLLCEQSARMIAMQTATDNSINLIRNLQLIYNKVRQSNITQEINEIISGASTITSN